MAKSLGNNISSNSNSNSNRNNGHLVNTGTDLHIRDNHNEVSSDSNPYAYPYFRASTTNQHHGKISIYDLVVRFDGLWRAYAGDNDALLQSTIYNIQAKAMHVPKEVLWKDSCGDTALHRLAQGARFPVSSDPLVLQKVDYLVYVAKALIQADPKATTAQNNWRETPLHQFCQHCGFPLELIETANETTIPVLSRMRNPMMDLFSLLAGNGAPSVTNLWQAHALHDACELQGITEDETSGNPLSEWMHEQHHRMVQRLILAHPAAILSKDDSNHLPLHRAVGSMKCGPPVLKLLLGQLMLEVPDRHDGDDDNSNFVGHVTRLAGRSLPDLYYKSFSVRLATKVESILKDLHDAESLALRLGSLWEKTLIFLQAESTGTVDSVAFLLTHAAIALTIPYCVIFLAVSLRPEELVQRDSHGRTPLILALEINLDTYHEHSLLQLLVETQPIAGSMPDSDGRLPLHLALTRREFIDWKDGTESIFRSEPTALLTMDPLTKLYPFMLAAMHEQGHPTTTFELLRADPSVINYS
jgi:hypothetical protein